MRASAVSADESSRLESLKAYGSLETIADEALTALSRAAATVCETPIALVTLVDETTQRIIANVGLDGVTQTSRDVSFCGHAILDKRAVFIVTDAAKDERFKDNPSVSESPHLRFYAGAPLVDDTGAALGTLCVIDRTPRSLSTAQIRTLQDLSVAATRILESIRASRKVITSETIIRSRLEVVLDATPTMIAYWSADLTNRYSNETYRRFFGWKESISGRRMREVIGTDLFLANESLIKAALRGEPTSFEHARERNGVREVAIGTYRPDIQYGVVRGVIATLLDVTAERKAATELAKRAELLALSEEMAEVGHWHLDPRTEAVFWSPQVYKILGLDPSFVPTLATAVEAYHPDDRPRVAASVQRAIERGESFDFELRIIRPNGEMRRVHSRGHCEVDAEGKAVNVFGVFQDITEREAIRERLVRQEKLATVGTLAAGVGHEINNPLSFILSNVEFALEEVDAMDARSPSPLLHELVDVLRTAREGAERIRKIVFGLRSFARDEVVLRPIDVGAAIAVSTQMALHETRHRATVSVVHGPSGGEGDPSGDVPYALADEGQLSQILVNLLVNASQAFVSSDPERNKIVVRTHAKTSGRVSIEVSDNGPGIPDDVLLRIFDPFFTTKSVGQGTGLGLSISHSIAESLGGELTCRTEVGKGSTFTLLLPVAPVPEESAREHAEPVATRRGRVLVIDDEPSILKVFTRILGAEHDLTLLHDARDAEATLFAEGGPFDVVFCDLMMPHVNGMQLFRTVLERSPELAARFVFMTGGTSFHEADTFLELVPNERIEKPFRTQNIRSIARRFAALPKVAH